MWLFVGLGNPGAKYEETRHNIGFLAIDALSSYLQAGPWKEQHKSLMAKATFEGETIWLQKPQTFMNASGEAVQRAASFYKIPGEKLVVFYDEIELELGKVRVKTGGGHAGHNGIRDIDKHFGNHYQRVRIGVSRPDGKKDVNAHVLGKFTAKESAHIEHMLNAVCWEIGAVLEGDSEKYMSRVAYRYQEETKDGI